MLSLRNMTIKRKLVVIMMLINTTAVLLACAGFVAYQVVEDRAASGGELTAVARLIGANSTAAIAFQDERTVAEILAGLSTDPRILSAHVYSTDRLTIVSYHQPNVDLADLPDESEVYGYRFESGRLLVLQPIVIDSEEIGAVYLVVAVEPVGAVVLRSAFVVALLLAASSLVALLLSSRLQHLISKPILHLVEIAETVSKKKDFSVRATSHSTDELGVLVEAFNEMLTQIQSQDAGLRQSEETLRELTESLPESIFEADLQGKLTYANQVLWATFGYSVADLEAGLSVLQLLDPEDSDSARANLLGSIQAGTSANHEYTGLRRDGTEFPVAIHSSVIYRDNSPVGLRGFMIDISDRKHLEKQLRQAQKMEAVGHLAGGIAHDFNNLLTSIIGHTQLALRQVPRDTLVADDLGNVLKVSKRAAELTRQLLAYARRQPLEARVIDLNSLIMQTSQLLAPVIGEGVELRFVAHDGLGSVRGDPAQIEQVLMNLAVNARDAMPGGGKLAIETANVLLDGEEDADQHPGVPPGSYVMFAVSDTGCGMDRETQKSIFEPFFTTKDVGSGTGLGLSTAYGIVRQHEGIISVSSEVGKGTCFNVYLPRVGAEPGAVVPEEDTEALPRGCETILLVEDEETVRSVVRRELQQQGYNVLTAAGAEEAEKLHEDHEGEIMLLLTDVVMRGHNGYELYQRVAEKQPSLKVVFMSGYTGEAFEGVKLPYDEFPFMQKPFGQAELARKVRQVLDT